MNVARGRLPEVDTAAAGVCRESAGDTIGVFQVESRAQAQMLPRLKPQQFSDLVVGISLIRPGPSDSGMMRRFVDCHLGLAPAQRLHPELGFLDETYGVMVYQEDVIKVCHHFAGLDLADADLTVGEIDAIVIGPGSDLAVVPDFDFSGDGGGGLPALGPTDPVERLRALIDEFNQGDSLEAHLAHDADQLAFLLELKTLADVGHAPPSTWIPNVQQRLQTDIGRSMADSILATSSDMWLRQKFIDRTDHTK